MLLIVADASKTLMAGKDHELATITCNSYVAGIAHQFVWMEFFTQRIYARLGMDLLEQLDSQDRQLFESLNGPKENRHGKQRMGTRPHH